MRKLFDDFREEVSLVLVVLSVVCCFWGLGGAYAQGVPGAGKKVVGEVIVPDLNFKRLSVDVGVRSAGLFSTDTAGRFAFVIRRFPDTVHFRVAGYGAVMRVFRSERDVPAFLTVRMAPFVADLGEVAVNTGYQSLRANEINGTVSVIDERMLGARTGTNILDRLVGQSSGLLLNVGKANGNPQNRTNISIRGLGTINGPLDPLVVLDNYIYEGDVNNINPFDIESVSILKDAAAASIWGARAGNGVIVITSKRGRLNQDLTVSFSANTTFRELPDLFSISQMGSADYVEAERFLFVKGYYNSLISQNNRALTPAVELLLANRNGKISSSVLEGQLDALKGGDVRNGYLDNFYRHAVLQQYALNVRGGNDRLSYLLSGGYDRSISESYAPSDRINLRFSQDYKLTKKLSFSTAIQLTDANTGSGRPTYNSVTSAGRVPAYLSFVDGQGNAIALAQTYRNEYLDTLGGGRLLNWKYYPADDYRYASVETNRRSIVGNFGLKYNILSGLNVDLGYQFQEQSTGGVNDYGAGSYYARNLVNGFSQLNRATGVVRYIIPKGGILRTSDQDVRSSTGRLQLNFNRNFGAHSLNVIGGIEARDVRTVGSGNQFYGYSADPLTYTNVDYVNSYPNFITGSTTQVPTPTALSDLHYRFLSLYSNMAYTYLGKYSLSASVRRDGSNIFGANTNDKWKPLLSVGGGWLVSNERFYNVDWLPVLRLTGTFGYSGNVDLTKTASAVAAYGTNAVTGLPTARVYSINNPELRWEQLSQLNLRLDFESRKRVLTGSGSFYVKRGRDLYGLSQYDYTSWGGAAELIKNVASMRGYGVDLELHSRNLSSGALKWTTDLYYSFNDNRTVEYYTSGLTGLSGLLGSGAGITPIVGRPLYAISAYQWGGLDNAGNPRGYLNGVLSTNYTEMQNEANGNGNNLSYIGSASPTHFGSLINTLEYKGLSLSFNISYRLGYFKRKSTISYSALASSGLGHSDYADRWQKPGDELTTDIPSFSYPLVLLRDAFFMYSEVNVIRADHVRLDYVNLSYRINARGWRFPLRSLEVYANSNDLGILWRANRFNLDPDYENGIRPFRGWSVGIKGSF